MSISVQMADEIVKALKIAGQGNDDVNLRYGATSCTIHYKRHCIDIYKSLAKQ